jgi:hypothetical protein
VSPKHRADAAPHLRGGILGQGAAYKKEGVWVYPEGGLSAYLFPNPAKGEAVLRVYAPEATPPGPHRLLAFLDRDGDGLLDRDEPWTEARVSAPARGVRLLVR